MLLGLLASIGGQEEMQTAPKALHLNTSLSGHKAWDSIGKMSRTLLFFLLAVGLCSLAFLFTPAVETLRMSAWKTCLAILLFVFALQGWNRPGEASTWQSQVCAGLVVCVGYHLTLGVWNDEQWFEPAERVVWVGLGGFVALCFLAGLLIKGYRNTRGLVRLVDLAVVVALWAWSGIAMVTYGMLWMAAWREPLWGPPYVPLFLLTFLSAALYSAFRFSYSGARVQRALLVALGLCTLVHTFR
jgi:hypothetical protein